jgi:DNA primase
MHLAHNPELDFAALRAHLASQGFVQELANLLDSDVYVHAGFARSSATTASAAAGWEHTFALLQRADVEADLRRALMEWAENPSEQLAQTIAALRALCEETGPLTDDDHDLPREQKQKPD